MRLWRLSIKYNGKRRYIYFSKMWKLSLYLERYTDNYFLKNRQYPVTDFIIKSVYCHKLPKYIDGYLVVENHNKTIQNKTK